MIRGINVGGKTVKMEDLRALFVALGYSSISTYIQSGNVCFDAPGNRARDVAEAIEQRIESDLGLAVTAVLRSPVELSDVVARNPFLRRKLDLSKLHVTFLVDSSDPALIEALHPDVAAPDEFTVDGREVFLHCPGGYGRTQLNNTFWERRLRVRATTRNWNTVIKLRQLSSTSVTTPNQ